VPASGRSGIGSLIPVILVAVVALGGVGAIIALTSSHGSSSPPKTSASERRDHPTTTTTTTLPPIPGITASSAASANLDLEDLPSGWIEQVLPPPAKIEPKSNGNGCSPVFGRSVVYDLRSGDFGNGAVVEATEGADSEVTVMSTTAQAAGALQALEGPGYAKTCIERSLDLGLEADLSAVTGGGGPTGGTGGTGVSGLTGVTGPSGGGNPISACEPAVTSTIAPVPVAYVGIPATSYDYVAKISCSSFSPSTPALEVDWVAFAAGHAFVDAQFFGFGEPVPAKAVRSAVLAMARRAEAHGI
jgi:hypothetical protein